MQPALHNSLIGLQIDWKHTACVPSSKPKTTEALICGERIKECMSARGLTQVALAEMSGMLSTRLGNYIQGTRELGIREAKVIAAQLRVPPAYLLGVVDEIDRDLLMVPAEKKRHFLQLIGGEASKLPIVPTRIGVLSPKKPVRPRKAQAIP